MNCRIAQLWLSLYRSSGPDELPTEERTWLEAHLKECPNCAKAFERQQQFDQTVSQAMMAVPIPSDLRGNLMKLVVVRRNSMLQRTVYRSLGVAASLLIAVGMVWGIDRVTRPTIDTDSLATTLTRELNDPERAVETWLTEQKLPPRLPLAFDYRAYDMHGTAKLQGENVPFISFRIWRDGLQRPDLCRVYIIRRSQFKMDELRDSQQSFVTIQTMASDEDVAYLIMFTSQTIEPFLLNEQQTPL